MDGGAKWGGAKTFFSGEGLFLLRCSGSGDMLVSSYGAINSKELAPGEVYVRDTGHLVAFEEGVGYEVHKAGSWKSTILGAEGLVAHFTGPGRIWQQTRALRISWGGSPRTCRATEPESDKGRRDHHRRGRGRMSFAERITAVDAQPGVNQY